MAKARAKKRPQEKKRPLWFRLLRALLLTGFVCFLLAIITVAGVVWYFSRDLPNINTINDYQPKQLARVYSTDGELIELWTDDDLIYRRLVPVEGIPEVMRSAVLAAEDADFYSHSGLDFPGLLRAIWTNVRSGRMSQGFSTITQQVVKNLVLSPERTIRRKIQEVLLAFRLEERLTKDEILGLYLNEVYFGGNRYGVEEACRYYFGKSVSEITLPEAALLAGLLPSPARYNPFRHPEPALERREYVLRQMWEKGFIPESAYRTALEAPLELAGNSFPHLGAAPHFTAAVREQLVQSLGEERLLTEGLDVFTTIDLDYQYAAEDALRLALHEYDDRHDQFEPIRRLDEEDIEPFRRRFNARDGVRQGAEYEMVVLEVGESTLHLGLGWFDVVLEVGEYGRLNPDGMALSEHIRRGDVLMTIAEQTTDLSVAPSLSVASERETDTLGADPTVGIFHLAPSAEAAFVAIDPRNRHVLAMVGGYDFRTSWFNRATQARRPCGSAYKPFIYGAALAHGLVTPASLVRDEPTPFRLPGGRMWNPQNSDGEYLGSIPLRTALARSRNVVSVRLLEELGLNRAGEMAAAVGIHTPLTDNLTAALGSTEMPVLELVNAYATIASGGSAHEPILVTHVLDPAGEIVLSNPYHPRQGMDPAVAYVLTSLMTSVIENGTGRAARALGRPAAGKTGTTNEARDAWFVGFVPQLVAGGWIGFDDYRPLGRREYGGRAALPMWLQFMQTVLSDVEIEDFTPPEDGVVSRRIDPATGLLAQPHADDFVIEIFIEGTEPTRYAPERSMGPIDRVLLQTPASTDDVLPERQYDDF